jgi:hypothetical protein
MLNPGKLTFSVLKEHRVGGISESWLCIDCGFDTAPGFLNRAELEQALAADTGNQGVPQTINNRSEVYLVRRAVWQAAGMEPWGGCLCIGCLEQRLGRRLKPKDFLRDHEFNHPRIPGTARLKRRRASVHRTSNRRETKHEST